MRGPTLIFENYYVYKAAIWLATHLPRGFIYFLAGFLAELNFFFNGRSRRGVYANQAHVLPPGTGRFTRWRTARAVFRHFAYSILDFFFIPRLSPENLHDFLADIRGWEHVQAAMAEGRGGIFVTAHLGSWELGGACAGMMGVPLTVAALSHKDKRIDDIFLRNRAAGQMEVVPLGGAMPKLEDALTRGRFIALVSDRDVKGTGMKLPFFGAPMRVPTGAARLALRTGAWIIPGVAYRERDWRIILDFRTPIIPDSAHDTEADLTQRYLRALEDFIRARPDQWLSFFDLWSETELPVA